MNITPEQAYKAFDILARLAGADRTEEHVFVRRLLEDRGPFVEYRFRGLLGTGGKFKINENRDVPYVDTYHELLTPERQAVIDRTNEALAQLFAPAAKPVFG